MLLNCVLEKTLENPLDTKEIQPVRAKEDQSWVFTGRTDAEAETPILWPPDERPWCWERLKVRGEGDDRGWDGWMALPTQWRWIWASSGSWSGKPGVLQSMGLQRVGHDWATELSWASVKCNWGIKPNNIDRWQNWEPIVFKVCGLETTLSPGQEKQES